MTSPPFMDFQKNFSRAVLRIPSYQTLFDLDYSAYTSIVYILRAEGLLILNRKVKTSCNGKSCQHNILFPNTGHSSAKTPPCSSHSTKEKYISHKKAYIMYSFSLVMSRAHTAKWTLTRLMSNTPFDVVTH